MDPGGAPSGFYGMEWQKACHQRLSDRHRCLLLQSFERSPANLVRMDKDNFVLTVPSSSESVDVEQQEELEKNPHAQHQASF